MSTCVFGEEKDILKILSNNNWTTEKICHWLGSTSLTHGGSSKKCLSKQEQNMTQK